MRFAFCVWRLAFCAETSLPYRLPYVRLSQPLDSSGMVRLGQNANFKRISSLSASAINIALK